MFKTFVNRSRPVRDPCEDICDTIRTFRDNLQNISRIESLNSRELVASHIGAYLKYKHVLAHSFEL